MVEKIKDRSDGEYYVLDAYFTQDAKLEPASVDGMPMIVRGKLADHLVVQVPMSASPEDLERISKTIADTLSEARDAGRYDGPVEPFIVTTNVQFLRFRRISHVEARSLMRKSKEELQKYAETMRARVEAENARDGNGPVSDGERLGDVGSRVSEVSGDGRVDFATQQGAVSDEEGR